MHSDARAYPLCCLPVLFSGNVRQLAKSTRIPTRLHKHFRKIENRHSTIQPVPEPRFVGFNYSSTHASNGSDYLISVEVIAVRDTNPAITSQDKYNELNAEPNEDNEVSIKAIEPTTEYERDNFVESVEGIDESVFEGQGNAVEEAIHNDAEKVAENGPDASSTKKLAQERMKMKSTKVLKVGTQKTLPSRSGTSFQSPGMAKLS